MTNAHSLSSNSNARLASRSRPVNTVLYRLKFRSFSHLSSSPPSQPHITPNRKGWFCPQFRYHFPDRCDDLPWCNGPQTMGFAENAVIETRPAPDLRLNHNAIVGAPRPEPFRLLWSKNSHYRHPQQPCQMHRPAVVANEEPAKREHRQKRAKLQTHRVTPLHPGRSKDTKQTRPPACIPRSRRNASAEASSLRVSRKPLRPRFGDLPAASSRCSQMSARCGRDGSGARRSVSRKPPPPRP